MATHSFGCFLSRFVGSTLQPIGQIRSINGPSKTTTSADGSHLLVRNAMKSFVPGLKDGGEVTLTVNFTGSETITRAGVANVNPMNYQVLFAIWRSRLVDFWRIIFATSSSADREDFWAFVTNLSPAIPEDDVITAELTLKCAGDEVNNAIASQQPIPSQIHRFLP